MDSGKAHQANADHIKFVQYMTRHVIQDLCVSIVNGLAISTFAIGIFANHAFPAAWTAAAFSFANLAYAVYQKIDTYCISCHSDLLRKPKAKARIEQPEGIQQYIKQLMQTYQHKNCLP